MASANVKKNELVEDKLTDDPSIILICKDIALPSISLRRSQSEGTEPFTNSSSRKSDSAIYQSSTDSDLHMKSTTHSDESTIKGSLVSFAQEEDLNDSSQKEQRRHHSSSSSKKKKISDPPRRRSKTPDGKAEKSFPVNEPRNLRKKSMADKRGRSSSTSKSRRRRHTNPNQAIVVDTIKKPAKQEHRRCHSVPSLGESNHKTEINLDDESNRVLENKVDLIEGLILPDPDLTKRKSRNTAMNMFGNTRKSSESEYQNVSEDLSKHKTEKLAATTSTDSPRQGSRSASVSRRKRSTRDLSADKAKAIPDSELTAGSESYGVHGWNSSSTQSQKRRPSTENRKDSEKDRGIADLHINLIGVNEHNKTQDKTDSATAAALMKKSKEASETTEPRVRSASASKINAHLRSSSASKRKSTKHPEHQPRSASLSVSRKPEGDIHPEQKRSFSVGRKKLTNKRAGKLHKPRPPKDGTIYFPKNSTREKPRRRWSLSDKIDPLEDAYRDGEMDSKISSTQTALDAIASPGTSRSTVSRKDVKENVLQRRLRSASTSNRRRRASRSKSKSKSSRAGASLNSIVLEPTSSHETSSHETFTNLLENIVLPDIMKVPRKPTSNHNAPQMGSRGPRVDHAMGGSSQQQDEMVSSSERKGRGVEDERKRQVTRGRRSREESSSRYKSPRPSSGSRRYESTSRSRGSYSSLTQEQRRRASRSRSNSRSMSRSFRGNSEPLPSEVFQDSRRETQAIDENPKRKRLSSKLSIRNFYGESRDGNEPDTIVGKSAKAVTVHTPTSLSDFGSSKDVISSSRNESTSLTLQKLYGGETSKVELEHSKESSRKTATKVKRTNLKAQLHNVRSLSPMRVSFRDVDSVVDEVECNRSQDDLDMLRYVSDDVEEEEDNPEMSKSDQTTERVRRKDYDMMSKSDETFDPVRTRKNDMASSKSSSGRFRLRRKSDRMTSTSDSTDRIRAKNKRRSSCESNDMDVPLNRNLSKGHEGIKGSSRVSRDRLVDDVVEKGGNTMIFAAPDSSLEESGSDFSALSPVRDGISYNRLSKTPVGLTPQQRRQKKASLYSESLQRSIEILAQSEHSGQDRRMRESMHHSGKEQVWQRRRRLSVGNPTHELE